MSTLVRAIAPSNIALVKYWGKRHTALNLPLTSSFSVTLSEMISVATVQESTDGQDHWDIQGKPDKAQRLLQHAREATGDTRPLTISIQNQFPSGAGLASSASSMAALGRALGAFLGKGDISVDTIADWTRQGSGSSVRSLFPGYVHWEAGSSEDGSDCIARTRFPASALPLALTVCVVNDQPKPIGSTAAMEKCRDHSPSYQAFHDRNPADLEAAIAAVEAGDVQKLGEISENNCLAMHDVIREAGIDYFLEGTHAAIAHVRALREQGVPCFFTIDAGPNVKILSPPEYQAQIEESCKDLPGVLFTLRDAVAETLVPVEHLDVNP